LSLIPENKKDLLRTEFENKLLDPVRIVMFTQDVECQYCSQTRRLAEEIGELSDKITAEVYDFIKDQAKAKELGIDKIPALAIIGKKDYGVRIYGMPFGYELQTFVEAIINVSKGSTDLSQKTREVLKDVKAPVQIKVFVTLTCPHCPGAGAIAHKLAVEYDNIKADVIEGSEFPDLNLKYNVMGVPKIIINDKVDFVGEFNEDLFAEHVVLGSI
jgi:glutaredoxin-like protein